MVDEVVVGVDEGGGVGDGYSVGCVEMGVFFGCDGDEVDYVFEVFCVVGL